MSGILQGLLASLSAADEYRLYAWGNNFYGQLGLGNGGLTSRSSPVQVGALTNWEKISSRGEASVSVKTDGSLWAWGRNYAASGVDILGGQLGDGTVVNRSSPVQIGSLTNWKQVSTGRAGSGRAFTAAIKTNGTVWAWGANAFGQVGDNTRVSKSSPVQIGALTNWGLVTAGAYSCFSIKTDNSIWAWGRGALGIGEGTSRSSPVQIGSLTDWAYVSAGNFFVSAVKTDGTLWAWGDNDFGQLGLNRRDATAVSSPVQVGALTNWSKTSVGYRHTVAVKTTGTLWAWGDGANGRVGDNAIVFRSSPVQIGALTNWSQGAAGAQATGAVKTDGTLWMWGNNVSGILGQNDTANRSSPVQVGALTNWVEVSVGYMALGITKN
jgi:alpha-tubulin suppressor-like RCC1 family protein